MGGIAAAWAVLHLQKTSTKNNVRILRLPIRIWIVALVMAAIDSAVLLAGASHSLFPVELSECEFRPPRLHPGIRNSHSLLSFPFQLFSYPTSMNPNGQIRCFVPFRACDACQTGSRFQLAVLTASLLTDPA
jgi:hypothetical protein